MDTNELRLFRLNTFLDRAANLSRSSLPLMLGYCCLRCQLGLAALFICLSSNTVQLRRPRSLWRIQRRCCSGHHNSLRRRGKSNRAGTEEFGPRAANKQACFRISLPYRTPSMAGSGWTERWNSLSSVLCFKPTLANRLQSRSCGFPM